MLLQSVARRLPLPAPPRHTAGLARTEIASGASGATERLVNADEAKDLEEAEPEQQLRHGARSDARVVRLQGGKIEARDVEEVGEDEADLYVDWRTEHGASWGGRR